MPDCVVCIANKATHGTKRTGKQYCKDCAVGIEGVGRLTGKLCRFEDCIKEPQYNFIGKGNGIYCSLHKLQNMEDVKHKKCEYIDENHVRCKSIPTYGLEGGKPKYCKPHSELFENMVLIRNDLCKFKDENGKSCGSRASYNLEGNKMGKFCEIHKGSDHVYVLKVDYCIEKKCKTRPSYNYPNETKMLYCELHKKEGMENIKDPRCQEPDCKKGATCAYDDGILMYCKQHKKEGMEDIRSKKCAFEGCTKYATHNVNGTKIRLYCGEHADKSIMTDVKKNKCIECKISQASCNYRGQTKRIYCCSCRKIGMIPLNAKICKNTFNINGEIYHCDTRCQGDKYDGYCTRCFVLLFPTSPKIYNYKTKETTIYEYIKQQFPELNILWDKAIGSSRRRPDICVKMSSYNIVIEVDEEQHYNYEEICENKRMMEIFMDLDNKPLVIIRFNPDKYMKYNKNIVSSCWATSKDGLVHVKKDKKKEWNERLIKLKEAFDYYLCNEPKKELEIIHLYYDELDK